MVVGRKRCFDEQQALEAAMRVFWQKGYAGASLMDLTQSMGINKPSMYGAFGNKEQLFIRATENYIANYASIHASHLQDDSQPLIQRLQQFMRSAVASQCGEHGPKGCYLSMGLSEMAGEEIPEAACQVLEQAKLLTEDLFHETFVVAQKRQELDSTADARQLAQYLATMLHGTAAMARAGKTLDQLSQTIQVALSVIPTQDSLVAENV